MVSTIRNLSKHFSFPYWTLKELEDEKRRVLDSIARYPHEESVVAQLIVLSDEIGKRKDSTI